jgi:hypothetical protein
MLLLALRRLCDFSFVRNYQKTTLPWQLFGIFRYLISRGDHHSSMDWEFSGQTLYLQNSYGLIPLILWRSQADSNTKTAAAVRV